MKKKMSSYENFIIEQLKDPELAAEYLREHWEYQGDDKLELLLQALHRIASAKGMTEVAKKSGISRRNLYKMFSDKGNPSAKTLLDLMGALEMTFTVAKIKLSKKTGSVKKLKSAA